MSSALDCGETGIWSNTRRAWVVVMAQAFLPHMESLCAVLQNYTNDVFPLQLVWEPDRLFPSNFINSDEKIISKSRTISISSYKTHIHTHRTHFHLLFKCQCITTLLLIDGAASHCPDRCLSREDSWSLTSTYLFCWSNLLVNPSWG